MSQIPLLVVGQGPLGSFIVELLPGATVGNYWDLKEVLRAACRAGEVIKLSDVLDDGYYEIQLSADLIKKLGISGPDGAAATVSNWLLERIGQAQ